MILGFTGTRNPITDQQRDVLREWISRATVLHHGACINADAEAHQAALAAGINIVVHPPVNTRHMMTPDWNHPNVEVRRALPYHQRNRDIVNASTALLALPDGPQRRLSGTWFTVGYATGGNQVQTANRRVIPVTICYPDGETEQR
jgi:hypothetical protein